MRVRLKRLQSNDTSVVRDYSVTKLIEGAKAVQNNLIYSQHQTDGGSRRGLMPKEF